MVHSLFALVLLQLIAIQEGLGAKIDTSLAEGGCS